MSLACRRCVTALTRHSSSSRLLFSSSNSNPQSSFQPLKTLLNFHLQHFPHHNPFESAISRNFSSNSSGIKNPKIIVEDETTDDEEYDSDDGDNIETASTNTTPGSVSRAYFVEDKIQEAADIGYKVIGPLQPSDRVFKPYEPAFAVVQIGSHQFKVSNGDSIYVEKLKYCEVNDKLILNKVLMVGSPTQTIIGRPILPEAAVRAVVEEHALDAKVIIFKKKRRKNYRRTKGHRQELTRLRITDVQGIEKPEVPSTGKAKTSSDKKVEKVAVAA